MHRNKAMVCIDDFKATDYMNIANQTRDGKNSSLSPLLDMFHKNLLIILMSLLHIIHVYIIFIGLPIIYRFHYCENKKAIAKKNQNAISH